MEKFTQWIKDIKSSIASKFSSGGASPDVTDVDKEGGDIEGGQNRIQFNALRNNSEEELEGSNDDEEDGGKRPAVPSVSLPFNTLNRQDNANDQEEVGNNQSDSLP